MRGKAYELFDEFKRSLQGASAPFILSRLILSAKIIPERITEELDDPALEKRLEEAIARLNEERLKMKARTE